jgi:hypothetical protein
MRERPDLERITSPSVAPSEEPDQRTQSETAKFRKKTPTDLAADAHFAHIEELHQRIHYHCAEIELLKTDVGRLNGHLGTEKDKAAGFCNRCTHLESVVANVGCLACLGTIMALAGSAAMGIAGAGFKITDLAAR